MKQLVDTLEGFFNNVGAGYNLRIEDAFKNVIRDMNDRDYVHSPLKAIKDNPVLGDIKEGTHILLTNKYHKIDITPRYLSIYKWSCYDSSFDVNNNGFKSRMTWFDLLKNIIYNYSDWDVKVTSK